jgi:hypothetical protein
VDRQGRIIACLVGQPRDPSYAAAAKQAYQFLETLRGQERFSPKERSHKRGSYPAIHIGTTYGYGLSTPLTLANKGHEALAQRLLGDKNIARLATFASGESTQPLSPFSLLRNTRWAAAFALWAPRLYGYYRTKLGQLRERMPELGWNFSKSIFPCATFNFGPNVWTFKHRDVMNCPFGWCSIQALGDFDPKAGGHLILWDLQLVVEFPPGALILIPSATLTHSNIPVQQGDSRASFTQYCGGGLFRYVDNGFRTEEELKMQDPTAYAEVLQQKKSRWEMGLGLFSTAEELLQCTAQP